MRVCERARTCRPMCVSVDSACVCTNECVCVFAFAYPCRHNTLYKYRVVRSKKMEVSDYTKLFSYHTVKLKPGCTN